MTAEVRRHGGPEPLAEAVGEALVRRLVEIQADGRVPSVALTGGSIARLVHRAAANAMASLDVDWASVDFWFGDERYVDAWSDERNAGQARRDLLERVGADPDRIHEMPAADSGLSLDEAAEAYSEEVRLHGGGAFDLVMLGVGPDGHVASLFPGQATLDVHDRIAVPVPDSPKPPPERISLTFPALNRTYAVWFVVAGDDKADVVARAVAGGEDVHALPAAGVRAAETIWWLDAAAASEL